MIGWRTKADSNQDFGQRCWRPLASLWNEASQKKSELGAEEETIVENNIWAPRSSHAWKPTPGLSVTWANKSIPTFLLLKGIWVELGVNNKEFFELSDFLIHACLSMLPNLSYFWLKEEEGEEDDKEEKEEGMTETTISVLKYILKPNAMVMLIFTHPSNRSMPVSTVLDPGEYVTMKSNYFYMWTNVFLPHHKVASTFTTHDCVGLMTCWAK